MSDDLFPTLPPHLSPRLAWLERHGLTCTVRRDGSYICALDDKNFGIGDTPDDACVDFCNKTHLQHWNQQNP